VFTIAHRTVGTTLPRMLLSSGNLLGMRLSRFNEPLSFSVGCSWFDSYISSLFNRFDCSCIRFEVEKIVLQKELLSKGKKCSEDTVTFGDDTTSFDDMNNG
jgi:hypothetical protein